MSGCLTISINGLLDFAGIRTYTFAQRRDTQGGIADSTGWASRAGQPLENSLEVIHHEDCFMHGRRLGG
jgi:hypothetical protein